MQLPLHASFAAHTVCARACLRIDTPAAASAGGRTSSCRSHAPSRTCRRARIAPGARSALPGRPALLSVCRWRVVANGEADGKNMVRRGRSRSSRAMQSTRRIMYGYIRPVTHMHYQSRTERVRSTDARYHPMMARREPRTLPQTRETTRVHTRDGAKKKKKKMTNLERVDSLAFIVCIVHEIHDGQSR